MFRVVNRLSVAQCGRRSTVRFSSTTQQSYKIVPACPEATCTCRQAPAGLDIDYKLPLSGTAPAYTEQVLLSTGKNDWTSRIEDDEHGRLARELKTLLGPKGKYFDPYRNVILTCSSIPSASAVEGLQQPSTPSPSAQTSACLLPSFLYVPAIETGALGAENFIKHFLVERRKSLDEIKEAFPGITPMDEVVVLICSHHTRDSRCGVLGPLLQDEFIDQLGGAGFDVSTTLQARVGSKAGSKALVASISHIGGHRWAGNVIIYIPPSMRDHPLAGRGIWYGRVMPEHVQGIVQSTICDGSIIQQLLRGGIEPDRSALRL